jgi:sortase A
VSSGTTTEPAPPSRRERRRADRTRTRDVAYGVVGVIGELLITLGVLLFAFLLWQLW